MIIWTLSRWAKVIKGFWINPLPTEITGFDVIPQDIDQRLFLKKRKNKLQEQTRLIILEALDELKKNPGKYGKPYKTIVPNSSYSGDTFEENQEKAREFGGHIADWVEQALEWAQRLNNGETWKSVCNTVDMSDCLRVVIGKDGKAMFVGGTHHDCSFCPATAVCYCSGEILGNPFCLSVPLVAIYK